MKIYGLQKLTLLDYPEKMACTVFTGGCNFMCPFCHNASLAMNPYDGVPIETDEILAFLKKRKNILDGICVSGGEPLIHYRLENFLSEVKALGYSVKLDTNGSCPERLKKLADEKLIDYVAMDIKNSRKKYPETVGIPDFDISGVCESVDFLMNGSLPYEFRTTVVREFHSPEDFHEIGEWIKGAERYFLQQFVDSGDVISQNLHAYSHDEMNKLMEITQEYVPSVKLRGV